MEGRHLQFRCPEVDIGSLIEQEFDDLDALLPHLLIKLCKTFLAYETFEADQIERRETIMILHVDVQFNSMLSPFLMNPLDAGGIAM